VVTVADAKVKFDILAKDQASDKFNKVGKAADQQRGKMQLLGKAGKLAAMGLAAGLVVAAGAAVKFVQAAIEDEASAKRMATQFRNSAGATKSQIAATEQWISAQGRAKGVADDDLRPALSNLVRATGDVGKAQKLAGLAMDISAGTGKDLGAVSTALAKAQNGNVGALSRLGVKTKDAEGKTMSFKKVVGQLGDTFKGAASKHADTTAGRFARLKLIGSELGESIGAKLLPPITEFAGFLLNRVGPALSKAGGWIQTNLVPPLVAVGGFIKSKVLPAFAQLNGGVSKVTGPLAAFAGWIKGKVVPAIQEVASYIGQRAKPVIAAFGDVWRTKIQPALSAAAAKFRAVQPAIAAVGSFLLSLGKAVFKVAAWILSKLLPPLGRLAGWILSKVIPAVAWLVTGLIRVVGAIAKFGSALIRGIGHAVKFASTIRTKIGNALDFIKQLPGKVKSAVSGAGKWLVDAGRKIIDGLISGIKSSLGKLGSFLRGIGKFVQDHKGPPAEDARMLTPAGILIMDGLMRGIESRKRALGKQLASVSGMVSGVGGDLSLAPVGGFGGRPGSGSVGSSSASHEALVAAFVDALDRIDWRIRGQDIVAVSNNFNRVRGHR
jgi:phage-related protein